MSETQKPWWSSGVQFECQGSGNCCVSRGEYGFVYLTRKDRVRAAKSLNISTVEFTKTFCDKTGGIYHIKDVAGSECQFLKDNKCSIYEGRPTQCRTWPFWPDTMGAKSWKSEVAQFCPGVGKGRVWSAEEIQKNLDEQNLSEKQFGS